MSNRPSSSSVKDFCARYGISGATYYRRREDMPRTIKVGGQLRITDADERTWLERKQAAADSTGRAA